MVPVHRAVGRLVLWAVGGSVLVIGRGRRELVAPPAGDGCVEVFVQDSKGPLRLRVVVSEQLRTKTKNAEQLRRKSKNAEQLRRKSKNTEQLQISGNRR